MCAYIWREGCVWLVLAAGQMCYQGMEQPGRWQLAAPAIPATSSATPSARGLAGSWVSSSRGKTKPSQARRSGITNNWGCFLLETGRFGMAWWEDMEADYLGCSSGLPYLCSSLSWERFKYGEQSRIFFRRFNISEICLLLCAPRSGWITWFAFLLRNICLACSFHTLRYVVRLDYLLLYYFGELMQTRTKIFSNNVKWH